MKMQWIPVSLWILTPEMIPYSSSSVSSGLAQLNCFWILELLCSLPIVVSKGLSFSPSLYLWMPLSHACIVTPVWWKHYAEYYTRRQIMFTAESCHELWSLSFFPLKVEVTCVLFAQFSLHVFIILHTHHNIPRPPWTIFLKGIHIK